MLVKQKFENQQGFTLVEALVATALFVVVMASVVGTYLYTVKINRRTDVIRTANENARFIVEFITKEVRNGQIDYTGPVATGCSLIPGNGSSLALVNVDGDHECFAVSGNNLLFTKQVGGATGTLLPAVQLNDAKTQVKNLKFYISPAVDVYTTSTTTQPTVTIIGSLVISAPGQAANAQNVDSVTIPIETTVSIPKYDF